MVALWEPPALVQWRGEVLSRSECQEKLDTFLKSEDPAFEEILEVVRPYSTHFALGSVMHGVRHWRLVAQNARALAKCMQQGSVLSSEELSKVDPLLDSDTFEPSSREPSEDVDLKVVRYFAAIHDSQRTTEHRDEGHAERAAVVAEEMYEAGVIDLTPEQMKILTFAIRHHADGQTSDDPTIGVCWDADRQHQVRFNMKVDIKYLSTPAARGLLLRRERVEKDSNLYTV